MKETFVGDIITLVVETKVDITSYDTRQIKYKKPSGIMGHWDASTGDENTQLEYTTLPADLDEHGIWAIQAYVEDTVNHTALSHGKWAEFIVYTPLIDTEVPVP